MRKHAKLSNKKDQAKTKTKARFHKNNPFQNKIGAGYFISERLDRAYNIFSSVVIRLL
jgi:hypothetical protein